MRSTSTSSSTPFDQGASSVRLQDDAPNPFAEGSVEFGNFELGRAHALRSRGGTDRANYLGLEETDGTEP